MLRRSAAFLVVVLVVFQNAGQTSSFTLRRNVRREPVPPHELPPDQARYAPVVPPHDKPLPEVPPNGLPQKPGTRYQPSPPQKPLPDLPVPANGIPQKPGSRYQPPLPQKPFPDNQLPSNGLPQKPSSRYQPSLPQKPLPDLPTNGLPQKPGTRYQPSPPQKPVTDLPAPPDGLPQVPALPDGKPSQETAKLLSILRDIRAELGRSHLYKAASEISDYSEPEEQLQRLGTERVLSPHVKNLDEADREDEIIADDPEGSISERERYTIEDNVLLSKILSLILEHQ